MYKIKTNKIHPLLYVVMSVFLFSGCAEVTQINECIVDAPYGFWGGLWHGFTIFFSFIGSLIDKNIAIYAVNNNGGWYDLGFLFGLFVFVKTTQLRITLT